ncbi:MAG: MATE family efflux transporter [Bacteroidales bacterium]|nr:MATE family efflux transporter [Bacteroidales bacterium]MBN2748692.1 MATE family efflux transporter [Bacteroidales bacterium]
MKTSISYSRIWSIAYPIIIGSIAQNVINVTDTAFLGRLGEVALGGGAIGGLFYLAVIMFGWGFGVGTQIVIARRNGEQAYRSIGRVVEHTLFFLLALALLLFGIIKLFDERILRSILESQGVFETSLSFLGYRVWGLFFAFTNFTFRAFYVGIARTKVITVTTVVMVMVNVVLDYALIFGKLGLPNMGVQGAALASVIAEATCTIAFIVFTLSRVNLKKYRLFYFVAFSPNVLKRLLKVAFPIMLQNFFSFSVWFVFFLIIEKMGESALAISNIVRSIYVVLLIPIMGFASATNTLVSFVIGQNRSDEVLSLVQKIALICTLGAAFLSALCAFFPEAILSVYTNDASLIGIGLPVLRVVSVASVFLALANILFNGVSGTGKTRVSFVMELVILASYLGLTYLLAVVLKQPITVVWIVEIYYAVVLSAASYIYLSSNRWMGAHV